MLTDELDFAIGVDTHVLTHTLVIVASKSGSTLEPNIYEITVPVTANFAGSVQLDYHLVPTDQKARAGGIDGFTAEAAFKVVADVTEKLSANALEPIGDSSAEFGAFTAAIIAHGQERCTEVRAALLTDGPTLENTALVLVLCSRHGVGNAI